MKKNKKNILLLLSIICCCLCCSTQAKAQEVSNNNEEIIVSPELQQGVVVLETPTSIVYNMGMLPARKLTENNLFFENPTNPYKELKTPAQIKRLGNYYFIVDCYHNQVIYSHKLDAPLKNWKVMTKDVNLPHSVDSDGKVYLVADTENHRVLVFEWKNGRFQNTQCLENIGERPHYIEYDEQTQSFYVWSSMTGEMYILKREPVTGIVCIQEIRQIRELADFYVRSFTLVGEDILFPSGDNCYMIIADKTTLEVKGRFPVTEEIAGMAFVEPIGNYFYITVSTDLSYNQNCATMIRTKDINSLAIGEYEEIYNKFSAKGVPYYIDNINGLYYVTNHGSGKSVLRFGVENDTMCHVGYLRLSE